MTGRKKKKKIDVETLDGIFKRGQAGFHAVFLINLNPQIRDKLQVRARSSRHSRTAGMHKPITHVF